MWAWMGYDEVSCVKRPPLENLIITWKVSLFSVFIIRCFNIGHFIVLYFFESWVFSFRRAMEFETT